MNRLGVIALVGSMALGGFAAEPETAEIRPMADTYLESDGSQVIDTGYKIGPRAKIVCEMAIAPSVPLPTPQDANTNQNYNVFGTGVGDTAPFFWYLQCSKYYHTHLNMFGFQDAHAPAAQAGTGYWNFEWRKHVYCSHERRRLELEATGTGLTARIYAGEQLEASITTNAVRTGTSTTPLCIFSRYTSGTYAAKMRLYNFKVYEAGALKMDLIPYACGVTGLVDRLTGKILTCTLKTAQPFAIGTDDGYVQGIGVRGANDKDGHAHNASIFSTEYFAKTNSKFEIDFALTTTNNFKGCAAEGERVFGTDVGAAALTTALFVKSAAPNANKFAVNCGDSDWSNYILNCDDMFARHVVTIDLKNKTATLVTDGITNSTVKMTKIFTKTAAVPIAILGQTAGDTLAERRGNDPSKARIYSLKIWEDDTLVHHYVPRCEDNIVSLYDLKANKMLHTMGWHTLTQEVAYAGCMTARVSTNAIKVASNGDAYLEAFADEAILTDYKPNAKSRFVIDALLTCTNAHAGVNPSYRFFYGTQHCGFFTFGDKEFEYLYYTEKDRTKYCAYTDYAPSTYQFERFQDDADYQKHTGVITWAGDKKITKNYLYISGKQLNSHLMGDASEPFYFPADENYLSIFGWNDQTTGIPRCEMLGRLYSMQIYDDGQLVRDYAPAVSNGVAGLWDKVNDKFLVGVKGGKNHRVGGAGWNARGPEVVEAPKSFKLEAQGTDRLVACAPGAVFYQWFKNGTLLEGETGNTLKVEWRRGVPHKDAYRCVAHFNVFGYAEANAEVESTALGLTVILK